MPLSKGQKANFATLQRAATNGDLALLECIDKATGQPVAVICAAQRHPDGGCTFTPLAKQFADNPYDEVEPPR